MKVVKNVMEKDFTVPYNFYTYQFPKDKLVRVNDDLYDFLVDRWPLGFSFNEKDEKEVPEVDKTKTKSMFNTQEVQTKSMETDISHPFRGADLTPSDGAVDKDGVSWYGEGKVIEGGPNVT